MNNFNFDENAINQLKQQINQGDLSNLLSQIPPEMMQNLSSMMQNQNSSSNDSTNVNQEKVSNSNTNNSSPAQGTNGFDFSNLDMNTILKMKSVMEQMNQKNDPRNNLLASLKPYLREGRREKLDQYANLMNFAKIAELLKNDNKEKK